MGKKKAGTQAATDEKKVDQTHSQAPRFFSPKQRKAAARAETPKAREISTEDTSLTEIYGQLKLQNEIRLKEYELKREKQDAKKQKEEKKLLAEQEAQAKDDARFEEVRHSMYS